MLAYCENKLDCRRKLVLSYFGEDFDKSLCNRTCDNCRNNLDADYRDISTHVKNLIQLVRDTQDVNITLIQCMDIYRGSKASKIIQEGHDHLDSYGLGAELKKTDMERIFHFLISKNILKEHVITNGGGFPTAYLKVRNFLTENLVG
jgi:bloom syndrome protein